MFGLSGYVNPKEYALYINHHMAYGFVGNVYQIGKHNKDAQGSHLFTQWMTVHIQDIRNGNYHL